MFKIRLKRHMSLPLKILIVSFVLLHVKWLHAEVTLLNEVLITDSGLHFDGRKVGKDAQTSATNTYDYYFGRSISAHGDSIKVYQEYVFMTWYRGGKFDRRVMLTRLNTKTGSIQHIAFPHRHTGFRNMWWIGESHNAIAVAISPINETIHLLYDMHAYSAKKPSDGSLATDYFRYSYSVPGAATVADEDFTLAQFVPDESPISTGDYDYKHLTMTGTIDPSQFAGLTYPTFFTNTDGTLLMYMRKGGNNNGGYVFNRYDAENQVWSDFTQFNVLNASNHGLAYDWGLYGNMKYVNGKLRVGFQRRSSNNNDKYQYQNGFYYAYSDHPDGFGEWKTHNGEVIPFPLVDADDIKIFEPGDLVKTTTPNQVSIVRGFDWNVTEKGDVHLIGTVIDKENKDTVHVHTYKPAGASEFITSTDFAGASEIYTAGDDIYIIGLTRDGYPFVEKAQGGTNEFSRIYQGRGGKRFDHGKVHISQGKLYYYLMERGSGSAQPLYLQIIDLDIVDKS
ncbi:hypothetical protein KUL49_02360 [Alteromonas sp. KUL49]|nr:hypothetical protein KUL49_02360 [Alteromonas sp. KUL49]